MISLFFTFFSSSHQTKNVCSKSYNKNKDFSKENNHSTLKEKFSLHLSFLIFNFVILKLIFNDRMFRHDLLNNHKMTKIWYQILDQKRFGVNFLQNQFLIQGATLFLLQLYSIILWQCFYNVLLFSVFHVFVLCKYDKSYIFNIINIQCHENLRSRTNARFLLFLIIYSSLVLVRIFGLVLTFWFNICLCVLF